MLAMTDIFAPPSDSVAMEAAEYYRSLANTELWVIVVLAAACVALLWIAASGQARAEERQVMIRRAWTNAAGREGGLN